MSFDNPGENINNRVRGVIFNDPENSDLHTVRTRSTGSFTPTGLRLDLRTTCMEVSTVAIKLPNSPLVGRNSMSIYNLSDVILYIGKGNVTSGRAIGNNSGWEIPADGMFNVDLSEDIELYGVVEVGTAVIKIIEYA